MATKTKKTKARQTTVKTVTAGTSTVAIANPTVTRANGSGGAHENIYEDAVKEIVALSENDNYAKKIDNGPMNEARGKDSWRLHTQLRAVDQVDQNLARHVTGIRTALSDVDEHLHKDTLAITGLLTGTRTDVKEWITTTQEKLSDEVGGLASQVKESFSKLAQATAGSEENIRAQTDSFSKAVENLLGSLQHEFDKKITEFRDEATRLIDKRFNQSDVAFAAIRADQEVIKALLTDIIKDRMGRADSRVR